MAKWEYCAIGPIKSDGLNWAGNYPKLITFTNKGINFAKIQRTGSMDELSVLAAKIAEMGLDGWEMTGIGPLHVAMSGASHIIYFKRQIE